MTDPLSEFVEKHCTGKQYDSCVESPCAFASHSGCRHPKHPNNKKEEPEKIECPICHSLRIISARHDSDWGGGNSIGTVNPIEDYEKGDLTDEGDVYSFGDIDLYVCLGCQFTWQKYTNIEKILSLYKPNE